MLTLLKKRHLLYLLIIIALGVFLRLYGLNWDQNHHLHPDERAIVMAITPLSLPNSIEEFLSPESPLNPRFFAYGSFPLYLLKIVGLIASNLDPAFGLYDKINLVGRFLSGVFDIGTLFVVFLLGKKIFSKTIGILAAFFYSISVFPIQASHFYAVDVMLTLFISLTLYQLIKFYESPSIKTSILVGVLFGASLAIKISANPLIVAIITAIAIDFVLIAVKQPHKSHVWLHHTPRFLKKLLFNGAIITFATMITFVILQPYAIIDSQRFLRQTQEVSQVINNAFTFPFTLQYVGKIPYVYELKNIFFWGLGPILATLAFLGTIYVTFITMKQWNNRTIILLSFFWIYFLVVGNFAVGFMRYMLPLYPLLCLFAAVFLYRLLSSRTRFGISLVTIVVILLLIWPVMFMHIYTRPNARVLASEWINQNIPANSTIAIEHWDDGMPLYGQQNYHVETLELYNPDTDQKWITINSQLKQTDYIVIASNRLYVPLQKLTDCQKLPLGKCFKKTAEYYKKLFDGSLGFQKVAEFSIYPQFQISNFKFQIRDEVADESFTVYDHPKVMIFKRR